MVEENQNEIKMTGRHPIYQVADKFKTAFLKTGFSLIDSGDSLEIEKADVNFVTWNEPQEEFSWLNDPIKMKNGHTILRNRILPGVLKKVDHCPPFRLVTFGRVYEKNESQPIRHQIEGLVVEENLTFSNWKKIWQNFLSALFDGNYVAAFELKNRDSYKISIKNTVNAKTYDLGYTSPATLQTMKTCNIEDKTGWVFVIDIDQFAQQYFSVEESASFYQNNVTFLKKFQCEDQTVGNCITNKVVSILRRMGYQETISKVLYPADAFKKMNMIQEEWDKNNQAYPLVDKLGDFTVARTTLTYAVEDIMSLNYQSGVSDLRIFEVTHSYFPKVDQVLPDEKLTVAIGSYGPDVTMESFTKEVRNFLTAMGIENVKFVPTNMAIAYKWNECMIIMHNDEYLHSNFGRINEKAAKNFNIGVPAYHAHFDLAALTEATKGN